MMLLVWWSQKSWWRVLVSFMRYADAFRKRVLRDWAYVHRVIEASTGVLKRFGDGLSRSLVAVARCSWRHERLVALHSVACIIEAHVRMQ
jgi:hypothetical protein